MIRDCYLLKLSIAQKKTKGAGVNMSLKTFYPQYFNMKISQRTKDLKELCSEHPCTHHLDSAPKILLYLIKNLLDN